MLLWWVMLELHEKKNSGWKRLVLRMLLMLMMMH
jgi:hypothetical protein